MPNFFRDFSINRQTFLKDKRVNSLKKLSEIKKPVPVFPKHARTFLFTSLTPFAYLAKRSFRKP